VIFSPIAIAGAWGWVAKSAGLDKLRALAPALYAIPLVIFSAEHFVSTRQIMTSVPPWMPGKLFWTYLVGTALTVSGFSLALRIQARLAATCLGIMFFLFVALTHMPNAVRTTFGAHSSAPERILWAIVGRDFSFGCAAFLLALAFSDADMRERFSGALVRCIAVVCVLYGLVHFWYPRFAPGVPLAKPNPDWMPGGPAWGYATGLALILGGIGMLFRAPTRRSSAAALGAALIVLVAVFYVPIMLAKPDVEGLNYVADTLMFAAGVLICAGPSAAAEKR
jgi:uncharacterized membrane protein